MIPILTSQHSKSELSFFENLEGDRCCYGIMKHIRIWDQPPSWKFVSKII